MGDGLPQLFYAPFKIERGKKYRVEIEMRCNVATEIRMNVSSESPTYHQFTFWQVPVGKDWKSIQYDFTANDSRDKARLHFAGFTAGNVYELRKASIREILP